MSEHTPGPWKAHGSQVTTGTWVLDSAGKRVCTMRACEQDWSNARLIAAAPTLLTTTKIAYTILADIRHEWKGRNTEEGQAALAAMRHAIAAAEGRDQQEVQDEYANAAIAKAKGKA